MSATTSRPAAEMGVPAEPDPGLAVGAAAVTGQITRWLAAAAAAALGEKAAPARKRFRNRPGRTTGPQARSAAPEKEHDMDGSSGRGHGQRRSWPRWAPALAALALIGLLATACGGDPSPAAARGGGGPTHAQAALAYARCMRAHGVPDFPDPDSNGAFHNLPEETPQETAADHVCHHLLTAGPQMNQAQQQHALGQLVRYARCMRAHGVPNFPDPTTTSGGIGQPPGMGFGGPGISVNSPQVQAANRACQSIAAHAKG
jgi:hypothetical protein